MPEIKARNKGGKILILCDYYLPGYKSGGGMRTIVNMIDRLKDKYKFFVVTRDHDGKLDRERYKTIKVNQWNTVRGAEVFYVPKDKIKISKLRELISEIEPDLIYSNSYFATFTFYLLILKKLNLTNDVNVIVAPCGELSEGALRLNSAKKKTFTRLSKLLNLSKNVIWKASSELEKEEIEAVKGKDGEIFIAPDMLPRMIFENYNPGLKPQKNVGRVKMIFLSRFMKKKNFKWLLENLSSVEGEIEIDIYGPLEDAEYWMESEKIIKTLPDNIKVSAKDSVPHERVLDTLVKYHFFIMPTLGENFGHIFLESLAAGCPLIISDRTPWLNLEKKGIGWDLSLEKPEHWIEKLNYCIKLDERDYSKLSNNARKFAVEILEDDKIKEDTLKLLEYGLKFSLTSES